MKHLSKEKLKAKDIDPDLLMVNMCEKNMRKLIKDIKEKRRLCENAGRKYNACINSLEISQKELDQYTKERDKFMAKIKDKTSKETPSAV